MILYAHLKNGPFYYSDPIGKVAWVVPIIQFTFSTVAISTVALPTAAIITGALLGYAVYELCNRTDIWVNAQITDEEEEVTTVEDSKKRPKPRTEPKNLEELLTLEEAKGGAGDHIMKDHKMGDPRYPKEDWKKMQQEHCTNDGEKINIHYWENLHTQEREGFKFKND